MWVTRSYAIIGVAIVTICCYLQPCDAAPIALASARQFLPPIPGYIPVYIRQGDQPLDEINLDLAAAFRAYAKKHGRIATGRAQNDLTAGLDHLAKEKEVIDDENTFIQKIKPKLAN